MKYPDSIKQKWKNYYFTNINAQNKLDQSVPINAYNILVQMKKSKLEESSCLSSQNETFTKISQKKVQYNLLHKELTLRLKKCNKFANLNQKSSLEVWESYGFWTRWTERK